MLNIQCLNVGAKFGLVSSTKERKKGEIKRLGIHVMLSKIKKGCILNISTQKIKVE